MSDLPDYHWLYSRTRAGRDRGPEGARRLLDTLGKPDHQFSSIRVVGTNGKGSTCAMLEAGCLACNVQTGCFTSPHLQDFEERIRINGLEISSQCTAEFIERAKIDMPDAAFFDLIVAFACQTFAHVDVQVAIIEAGVGGVTDATHALEKVQAVCLTNVSLDHTGVLGSSIAQIASDKAHAVQKDIPLITTATHEAWAVAQAVAWEVGAPFYSPQTHPSLFELPHMPAARGHHQQQNAALAAATLRILDYEQGLSAALAVQFPARLESLQWKERTIVIDGAHNPAAAQAIAQAMPSVDVLLFGSLGRKDSIQVLKPLLGLASQQVFTLPSSDSICTSPEDLVEQFGGLAMNNPAKALAQALELTPTGGVILVIGSLYLAGQVRTIIEHSNH